MTNEWIILPDIRSCEVRSRTVHDNTYTIHYVWMSRWRKSDNPWGLEIQVAHVNSKIYREWIKDHVGIPPHICFGGAVVSGKGDPNFKKRWEAYALETFV